MAADALVVLEVRRHPSAEQTGAVIGGHKKGAPAIAVGVPSF